MKDIYNLNIGKGIPNAYETHRQSNLMILGFNDHIEVWQLEGASKLNDFPVSEYIKGFTFNPNGQQVAGLAGNGIIIWDVISGKITRQSTWEEDHYESSTLPLQTRHISAQVEE
jgi:hypothetical protein